MVVLTICMILVGLPWLVYPQDFYENVEHISDDELNFIERMIGMGTTPGVLGCPSGTYTAFLEDDPIEIRPGRYSVDLTFCKHKAYVSGDPHFRTLDGHTFSFHGTCAYTLAQYIGPSGTPFRIISEFHHATPYQREMNVTSPKNLIVEVCDLTIKVDLDPTKKYKVYVNDEEKIPPIFYKHLNLAILSWPDAITVARDCGDDGFLIRFQGYYPARKIDMLLTAGFTEKISGMFGNFDGDENNDFMKPDGTLASDNIEFGVSWKNNLYSEAWCESWLTPYLDVHQSRGVIVAESNSIEYDCGKLTENYGPFEDCWLLVDPTSHYDNCVFDLSVEVDSEHYDAYYCDTLDTYAELCRAAGVTIDWRTENFCAPICEPNMHFDNDVCLHPDPVVCAETLHTRGCVCDEGFVKQGVECLEPSELGCVDSNGFTHELFDSWHDCEELCTCVAPDSIECEPDDCPTNWNCVEAPHGSTSCVCNNPICAGVCSATEDGFMMAPHMISSRLPKSSTIIMAETEGPISNPCKVKITVVTDRWHTVRRMEISIGVHPNNPTVYYRRFIFNFGPTTGVIVAGYEEGAPHRIEISDDGYFDNNGEYSVSITNTDSWNIEAYCLSGLGQQLLSMSYATPDPDYFWLFVNQPLHWTGACFPI